MPTTNDSIAAFLARGGSIIKCPDGDANATPLRTMRKRFENGDTPLDSERAAERRQELFGAARLDGFSVSDALDFANGDSR